MPFFCLKCALFIKSVSLLKISPLPYQCAIVFLQSIADESSGPSRVHSRISSDGSVTSLILDKITRGDSGEYQLTLKTEDSECCESITLLVSVIGEIINCKLTAHRTNSNCSNFYCSKSCKRVLFCSARDNNGCRVDH